MPESELVGELVRLRQENERLLEWRGVAQKLLVLARHRADGQDAGDNDTTSSSPEPSSKSTSPNLPSRTASKSTIDWTGRARPEGPQHATNRRLGGRHDSDHGPVAAEAVAATEMVAVVESLASQIQSLAGQIQSLTEATGQIEQRATRLEQLYERSELGNQGSGPTHLARRSDDTQEPSLNSRMARLLGEIDSIEAHLDSYDRR